MGDKKYRRISKAGGAPFAFSVVVYGDGQRFGADACTNKKRDSAFGFETITGLPPVVELQKRGVFMTHFEFNGEEYKKASRHQKEWGSALIASLELKGNESVLDLGCGDGVLTEQISTLVPEGNVLGIDASNGMLHTARKLEKPNLKFQCMDIEQLDFHNAFDVIFSNACLHWVKNHEKLLRNCRKALKPNGCIAWNFAGAGTCQYFNPIVQSLILSPAYQPYFLNFEWPWYMVSVDDYRKLVSAAGFRAYQVTGENQDRFFDNTQALIHWLDQPSLVPFVSRLPDEVKERFRTAVIDQMLKKSLMPDGRCFETFRRIHVAAYK